MSIRNTKDDPAVALYDGSSGMAFGPTFEDSDLAEDFLKWLVANGYEREAEGRMTPVNPSWADLHGRWFDERVDPETGFLKEVAEQIK